MKKGLEERFIHFAKNLDEGKRDVHKIIKSQDARLQNRIGISSLLRLSNLP
jgi:hypothetical protein